MLSPLAANHRAKAHVSDVLPRKYLGDLGKPTLRGVRKCAKCGTLNGTRGIRCKNMSCDQVFKSGERKKPSGPEAAKLVTDAGIQLYSVRSKTGDNRGFVQLPIVQDLDGNPAVVDVDIVCSAAKCYVETCARSKNENLDPCFHIQSSVEALDEALPLTFKNSVLNSMPISAEMRQQIWSYATEKQGPLVQRVTNNTFAVKTAITVRDPLGYLHFTFLPNKKDEKRFVCSCRDAKVTRVTMSDAENGGECTYRVQRCVHFYACICAFSSDEALSKEFQYAIEADMLPENNMVVTSLDTVILDPHEATIEPVADEAVVADGMVEVGDDELHAELTREPSPVEVIISTGTANPTLDYTYSSNKMPISASSRDSKRFKPNPVLIQPQTGLSTSKYQTFMQWLQMVTERINLTMHYALPGNPKPLIFYIPQLFWDCFMNRISSCTSNKRRLPNRTCTVLRTQAAPLGTFTQFTWYLTELSNIKKVFDTPEVQLQVSKYYDKAADGTYILSNTPRIQVDTPNSSNIHLDEPKPLSSGQHEYKTYMRVGLQGSHGLTPFIIDWTPDLFPSTHTGELSFTFQYSHMVDGLSPAVDDHMVHHVIEGTSKHHHNIIIDM